MTRRTTKVRDLAYRIESLEAYVSAATAEPLWANANTESVLRIAGGTASFAGVGSPVSKVLGLGFEGPLQSDDFDRIEDFFAAKKSATVVACCPFADPSLTALTQARAYRLWGFESVLCMTLGELAMSSEASAAFAEKATRHSVHVERLGHAEGNAARFAQAIASALTLPPEAHALALGEAIARIRGARSYVAMLDGAPIGGAAMVVHDRAALLFATSIAKGARRRGAHRALLDARIRDAGEAGCDFVALSATPGSASERNAQRVGFRVAYARTMLVREYERGVHQNRGRLRNDRGVVAGRATSS